MPLKTMQAAVAVDETANSGSDAMQLSWDKELKGSIENSTQG